MLCGDIYLKCDCLAESPILDVNNVICHNCGAKVDLKHNMTIYNYVINRLKAKKDKLKKEIFESLNLSDGEQRYISISESEGVIYFSFSTGLVNALEWIKEFCDKQIDKEFNQKIAEFFDNQLEKGGFKNIEIVSTTGEPNQRLEYYKEFDSIEEAKEAVKWLVSFKQKLGLKS